MTATLDLADRFFAAIEAGDLDAVASVYAPEATIWHASSGTAQTRAQNLKTLGVLIATLSERRYTVQRRAEIPGGFMQQHVLTGRLPDGSGFALPACLIALVDGGHINRIEEYFDSRAAARFSDFV